LGRTCLGFFGGRAVSIALVALILAWDAPRNLPRQPSVLFCARRIEDLYSKGLMGPCSKSMYVKPSSRGMGILPMSCRNTLTLLILLFRRVPTPVQHTGRMPVPLFTHALRDCALDRLRTKQPGPIPNQSVQAPNFKHSGCPDGHSFLLPRLPCWVAPQPYW